MHLLSTTQIKNTQDLERLFYLASNRRMIDLVNGYILGIVKDEGSTRTRLSFEVAMKSLGGDVVLLELDGSSSIAKGETVEDSIKTISQYVDAIVMRHSRKGMVQHCAKYSDVPVINAGDGDGEHPTQALLDVFTIWEKCGRLDNLNIMMAGDLKCSRTVHSLIYLLSLYGKNKVTLVSPEDMQLPEEYKYGNIEYEHYSELNTALDKIGSNQDILYMTRLQRERYMSKEEIAAFWKERRGPYYGDNDPTVKSYGSYYVFDEKQWDKIPNRCGVMHPLPRNQEIPAAFDDDPRALYFHQAKNGVYVRMVLLSNLLLHGIYFR